MLGCKSAAISVYGRERPDEAIKRIKRESSDRARRSQVGPYSSSSSNSVVSSQGTLLNTVTPCAACKLLRRRCAQECPFSPYFSPHEPHKFASVHKVFGASNVSKMLTEVQEHQRFDAANSLVYEANIRIRDPVYGCMGAISTLQQQVQALEAELNMARTQLLKMKYYTRRTAGAVDVFPTMSHEAFVAARGSAPLGVPLPPPVASCSPLSAPSTSSSSSIYTLHSGSTTTDYCSSITTDNVPFFG